MEELSMVLLTIPVFFPIVTGLGFDPVWFGVLIVLVVQIGLISPPVGMNLFVLNSLLKGVPLAQIFRGVWLFVVALVLALVVLGGIYGGVFTATEGAGIGASGAFFFALARGTLTWRVLYEVLVESVRTTAMLFTILIAATIFSSFVNFTTMPGDLKDWILNLGLSPTMVVGAMMLIYVLLGTIMEELSMVLLTIPVFFPIVTGLGFDPVWFGVLIVLVVQIGLISPPVGMNLFVLSALLKDVSLPEIFRGVWLFVLALVVALVVVLEVQPLALWLPSFMR
jgi:tripartite ATP-independent transporter DctM subunit